MKSGLKALPFEVNQRGTLVVSTGTEHLKDIVVDLLATQKGTVFYNRERGWEYEKMLFKGLTPVLCNLLENGIRQVFLEQEPRVKVLEVNFTATESEVLASIEFLSTETRETFIIDFPFNRR